jgi:lipid-A-disaccharide synthase
MKLAVVAGEASGDLHASEVVRELKELVPALETFGIGGDLLAAEGMRLLHHAKEMGIVGLFNVLRNLRMFRRIFDDTVDAIARERPDAVLLVDYPGFNLRLAKRCRKLRIRVIYYISPQVWAWRQGRVNDIAKIVDRMIVLFPFEEEFYRKHDVAVTYVGHPLIDELAGIARGERPPSSPLSVALLPGSRRGEVKSLLPPMLDAVHELGEDRGRSRPRAFVVRNRDAGVRGDRHAGDRDVSSDASDALAGAAAGESAAFQPGQHHRREESGAGARAARRQRKTDRRRGAQNGAPRGT